MGKNPFPNLKDYFESLGRPYLVINLRGEQPRYEHNNTFCGGWGEEYFELQYADHEIGVFIRFTGTIDQIIAWLRAHPDGFVAAHCQAGKARTGTLLCAILGRVITEPGNDDLRRDKRMNLAGTDTIETAFPKIINYYSALRMRPKKGGTVIGVGRPSQRRWVYCDMLRYHRYGDAVYQQLRGSVWELNNIVMGDIPQDLFGSIRISHGNENFTNSERPNCDLKYLENKVTFTRNGKGSSSQRNGIINYRWATLHNTHGNFDWKKEEPKPITACFKDGYATHVSNFDQRLAHENVEGLYLENLQFQGDCRIEFIQPNGKKKRCWIDINTSFLNQRPTADGTKAYFTVEKSQVDANSNNGKMIQDEEGEGKMPNYRVQLEFTLVRNVDPGRMMIRSTIPECVNVRTNIAKQASSATMMDG